nr:hypothetical protein [Tanacetum cinerariifolium]
MDSLSPQVVFATKLPILNPNEFDLWKMRIEQYFLMTDYSLWEVILNGDSPVPTRLVEGVAQPVAPTTDAKSLMEAIEKRFGGNTETKKVQKTLLKQQFENFSSSSSEGLDQIHDRLQKLVSQLEIHGSREIKILVFLNAYFIALRGDTQHLSIGDFGKGYSRKRQKQSLKQQNQTRNGKDRERQSHLKPKVKSQSPRSTKVNPGKVKVNPDKAEAEKAKKYTLRD